MVTLQHSMASFKMVLLQYLHLRQSKASLKSTKIKETCLNLYYYYRDPLVTNNQQTFFICLFFWIPNMPLTKSKAIEAFTHVLNNVFEAPSDGPLAKALEHAGYSNHL